MKINKYLQLGGVKFYQSNSSSDKLNLSTYTCGRLFAHIVQKVAFIVTMAFVLSACRQATLISSDENTENTRGTEATTEEPKDSTQVNIDFDTKGWEGAIDAGFEIGGTPQEGGEK